MTAPCQFVVSKGKEWAEGRAGTLIEKTEVTAGRGTVQEMNISMGLFIKTSTIMKW